MKFKVQEHEERIKEFIIYQLAPNGELCRRVASCRDKKEAEEIASMLNDNHSAKVPRV